MSSSAISSAASGRASRRIAARHRGQPRRVVEQRTDQLGRRTIRSPGRRPLRRRLEVARVLRLVVAGRKGDGHEHRGLPRCCELPDRTACPREREVARAERGAELFRERQTGGSRVASRASAARRSRASPERWSTAGPARAEGVDRQLVQQARAQGAAEHEQHGPASRQPEETSRLPRDKIGRERAGIGRPVTRYFGPSRPAIGNERKTLRAKGTASLLASPRCASASINAAGIFFRAAA